MNGTEGRVGKRGWVMFALICLLVVGIVAMGVMALSDRTPVPARGSSTMPGQAAEKSVVPPGQ